ncbi:uncharacterized protein [Hetaerina americana]|uniref:uncharacterized protein n=1 Tax=Hetaerina americana TaxID=62018 RepID=UPI003A7F215C
MGVASWSLEKYAHLHNETWIQADRRNGKVHLVLQGSLLLVVQANVALESVALIHTNCRGLTRGSTILFLIANQTEEQHPSQGPIHSTPVKKKIRKFRVKFSPEKGKSAEEQKASCITALRGFMMIYDTDGGLQEGNIYSSNIAPLKEIAWKLLEKSEPNKLPGWDGMNISLEEDLSLERAIKLCLLDPSFPILVQKIEGKLQGATLNEK